ncbi:uncharacterized protein C8A04DRAFT_12280 [Dichotomopilus funicola]|uniref:Uncharacterized protein n=1 Tax=Dichotomopilus funicola TaxID=1934379 RepID=A0AAN6V362_9PEZI|nr:hypothetical protein C8A04DRAFT_12280 [Dichotomopilus funicola]
MCNFIQREYSCGHYRFIASKWCETYTVTHKRCPAEISYFEYASDLLCGDCKAKTLPPVPWEFMIKRHDKTRTSISL